MSKRKSRELALQFLYQTEFSEVPTLSFDTFKENFKADFESWGYSKNIIDAVKSNKTTIDQLIESNSKNWSLNRMTHIDRNILRMAIGEMKYLTVPPKSSINEAIEIAKKFSNQDSSKFINGLLDKIAQI